MYFCNRKFTTLSLQSHISHQTNNSSSVKLRADWQLFETGINHLQDRAWWDNPCQIAIKTSVKKRYQSWCVEATYRVQANVLPCLLTDKSLETAGLCGQQAAARINNRITSPPTAIPIMTALETETAEKRVVQGLLVVGWGYIPEQLHEDILVLTSLSMTRGIAWRTTPVAT